MTAQLYNTKALKVAQFGDQWGILHFTCTGNVYISDNVAELENPVPTGSAALQQGLYCEAPGPYSFWVRGDVYAVAGGTPPVDPNTPSQVRMMVLTYGSKLLPAGI